MPSAVYELPFGYDFSFLRSPRHRKIEEARATDILRVQFKELSTDAMPEAFRVVRGNDHGKPEVLEMLRWNGSDIYSAVGDVGNMADLQRKLNEGGDTPLRPYQELHTNYRRDARRPPPLDPILKDKMVQDYRSHRVAEIVDAVDSHIVVDGQFWTKRGEPCWKVSTYSNWGGDSADIEATVAYLDTVAEKPESYYRADRLEDALTCLRADGYANPRVRGSMEIVQPEALSLAAENLHLAKAAGDLATWLAEGKLGEASVEMFIAFADVRDIAREARDETDFASLADASRDLLDHVSTMNVAEAYTRGMEMALMRWRLNAARATPEVEAPRLR